MKKLNLLAVTLAALFAFSSSAKAVIFVPPPVTVPEGGDTFAFLAIAFVAVALLRRQLAKRGIE